MHTLQTHHIAWVCMSQHVLNQRLLQSIRAHHLLHVLLLRSHCWWQWCRDVPAASYPHLFHHPPPQCTGLTQSQTGRSWESQSLHHLYERERDNIHKYVTVSAGLYNVKAPCHSSKVLYSEKLSREKTFINFVVLWLFTKVFSAKFGGMASFGTAKASNQWKFSPYFSLIYKSFSPSKVACCTVQLSASRSQTCKVLEALLTRYCWD